MSTSFTLNITAKYVFAQKKLRPVFRILRFYCITQLLLNLEEYLKYNYKLLIADKNYKYIYQEINEVQTKGWSVFIPQT